MKKRIIASTFVLLFCGTFALAQEETKGTTDEKVAEVKGAVDGINEQMAAMQSTLDALAKIKFTGYLQEQFQVADSDAAPSFAGGNFASGVHSRFMLRRGRMKLTYDNVLTQYVLQIDVAQTGLAIKDAYITVKEPWMKAFSLTTGVFDRPFGFEISYSSSNREAPERTRMYQTLFPGERDMGAKIEYATESGPLSFLNFKGGLFNGTRENTVENDNYKDFIGRLGATLPFSEQNFEIDGGVSVYSGKVNVGKGNRVYKMSGGAYSIDSTTTLTKGYYADRTYIGADAQLYYDLPVIGGMSLRGELITGEQPGSNNTNWQTANTFYNAAGNMYRRKFVGYYLNYVQNVGDKNQFVLKYDVFDPNTDISASDAALNGSNFTVGDVKFTTLGLGWVYHWDGNVKFTLYYDMVSNEKVPSTVTAASLKPYVVDLKDNVLTLRAQYKF